MVELVIQIFTGVQYVGQARPEDPSLFVDDTPVKGLFAAMGMQTVKISVSPGVHQIRTEMNHFDITVSTDGATPGFRFNAAGDIIPKQKGIWYDTTRGYIAPKIIRPVKQCWFGFITTGISDTLINFDGNVVGTTVTETAHPEYFRVSNIHQFYDIRTNTIDYSHVIPDECPYTSVDVTIRGTDGQTLDGIMSIFDYSRLASATITFEAYGEQGSAAGYFTKHDKSRETPNLSAEAALNFITGHHHPAPAPPPAPQPEPAPETQPVQDFTNISAPEPASEPIVPTASSGDTASTYRLIATLFSQLADKIEASK